MVLTSNTENQQEKKQEQGQQQEPTQIQVQSKIPETTAFVSNIQNQDLKKTHGLTTVLHKPVIVFPPPPPVLLFPVRLETRFGNSTSGPELWVRIYPDQVEIDSHDPSLTHAEVSAGQAYWSAVWGINPSATDILKNAWRTLAGSLGSQRAAWVASVMTPTNLPAAGSSASTRPAEAPVFPRVQTSGDGLVPRAPMVKMLPHHWTIVTYVGTKPTHTWTGPQIMSPLPIRLSVPGSASSSSSPTSSISLISDGTSWLFDFEQALAAGMAARIKITSDEANTGFDRVIAVGIAEASDAEASAQEVVDLINAHHFSDGFAFIPQGTPTKNSPVARSGFNRGDQDFEKSFAVERLGSLVGSTDSDSAKTASFLGIPSSTFDHIENADCTDQFEAEQMSTALWPATLGYFFQELMNGTLSSSQLNSIRDHFVKRVRGRGPLPAFRIGRTPYGILPITSISLWNPAGFPDPVQSGVVKLLRIAWSIWLASANGSPRIKPMDGNVGQSPDGGAGSSDDPDKDLVQVMGMDASTVSYNARWLVAESVIQNWQSLSSGGNEALNAWNQARAKIAATLANTVGANELLSIFNMIFSPGSSQIATSTIQDGPLSETDPLRNDYVLSGGNPMNYIQLLTDAYTAEIENENYLGSRPTPLLYMILRQSLLLQQYYTASDALVQTGWIQPSAVPEQDFVNFKSENQAPTRWDVLSMQIPGLSTRDGTIGTYNPLKSGAVSTRVMELNAGVALNSSTLGTVCSRFVAQTGPHLALYPSLAALDNLQASFLNLSTLPTARLERLLNESLDVCSHRLDAWVTSIATWLLDSQRNGTDGLSGQPKGLFVGCYGWIEDLRPSASNSQAKPIEKTKVMASEATGVSSQSLLSLNPMQQAQTASSALTRVLNLLKVDLGAFESTRVLPGILQPQENSGGFVHAPSLDHAATVAVLRNGYLTHQGTSEGKMLSIDLASDRVREALWLLDGIRQGQSLGALLGYRFEIAMHKQGLDATIQSFRSHYPMVANKLVGSTSSSSSSSSSLQSSGGTNELAQIQAMAAASVVDGMALLNDYASGLFTLGGALWASIDSDTTHQVTISSILQDVDLLLDALGDLATAEAVFQLMHGNTERAGAILNAVSRGDNPPEPAIVRTPLSGADYSNRLMILFPEPSSSNSSCWGSIGQHARAKAEPTIDSWLSRMLPNPSKVQCTINYAYPSGGAIGRQQNQGSIVVSLADIDAGPLDFLAMANAGDSPGNSELEQRLIYYFYNIPRTAKNQIPQGASSPSISFNRDVSWTPDILSFPEALTLARSMRELVQSARVLAPEDLIAPGSTQPDDSLLDATDLFSRANDLSIALNAAIQVLIDARNALLAAGAGDLNTTNSMREAMMNASWFGATNCIPKVQWGTDSGQGSQIAAQAVSLINQLSACTTQITQSSSPSKMAAAIQQVFGASFVVLPKFKIPTDSQSQNNAIAFSQPLNVDQAAGSAWIQRLTHVRLAISRLDKALSLSSVIAGIANSGTLKPTLAVSQLPLAQNDQWLALPLQKDQNGNPIAMNIQGRVCLEALMFETPAAPLEKVCGLLIDDWVERIPSSIVTTGVAFQYDEPRSRAPQTLLLGVCPDKRQEWDTDALLAIVGETIDLSHMRTVDLDLLTYGGQILPLLYFAFNPKQSTISINLPSAMKQSNVMIGGGLK